MKIILGLLPLLLAASPIPGCREAAVRGIPANPIAGTWYVEDSDAPFHQHMYVFNADGAMQQANPDAGDATTRDGKGTWIS